jgi:hypothetical protein
MGFYNLGMIDVNLWVMNINRAKQPVVYWLLIFGFAILAFAGVAHHELWLDEAHHYLFARDSRTLSDLWHNMRYDGHPILWNVLLMPVTYFSTDPSWMQWFHVLIAVAAVGIFLFYSPFRIWEKILFISGYFMLYEYTVISRNYALFMLFLFSSLVCYDRRRYVLLGVMLVGLANTHFFGLAAAAAFVFMVMADVVWIRPKPVSKPLWIGAGIFLAGAIVSLLQIVPPPDSWFYTHINKISTWDRLARASVAFWKAFVPVPDVLNYCYWNTNLLMEISKPLCALISAGLFFVPLLIFRRKLSVAVFFYAGAIFMLLFFYVSDFNANRYYGTIYFIFIASVWISRTDTRRHVHIVLLKNIDFKRDYTALFITTVLIVQVASGVVCYTLDLVRPFSEARYAAWYMRRNDQIHDYVAVGCGTAPVAAYLETKIYYLNNKAYGSFCFFNQAADPYNDRRVKRETLEFVRKLNRPAFLILHSEISLTDSDRKYITFERAFDKSVLTSERYFVYRVSVPSERAIL